MDPSSSSLFVVVPKSVEELSKRLKSRMVDTTTLHKLIDLAVRYWQNENLSEEDWKKLVCDSYLPETIFHELYSGILTLTLSVFRLSEKKFIADVIIKELVSLGLTPEQASYIVNKKASTNENIPKFLRVKDAKWRIDVTISTSSLNRVLEPWILMELDLESGEKKLIHLPISQFHNLRYQVALRLNQLNQMSA